MQIRCAACLFVSVAGIIILAAHLDDHLRKPPNDLSNSKLEQTLLPIVTSQHTFVNALTNQINKSISLIQGLGMRTPQERVGNLGRASSLQKWASQTYEKAFKNEADVASVPGLETACERRNFVVIKNQSCGLDGFGNCMLGLVSALHVAILTDSIPLFLVDLKTPWQFRHGAWSVHRLKSCYKRQYHNCQKVDLAPIIMGLEELPRDVVALRNQKKGLCASLHYAHTYHGQNLVLSHLFPTRSKMLFPDAFSTAFSFGTFDTVIQTFLRLVPSATQGPQEQVLDNTSWLIEGPLISVHIRRGDCIKTKCVKRNDSETVKARAMGLECLTHMISKLDVPKARVYIATTKYIAWKRYSDFYELTPEGFATRNTGGRRVQFRTGPSIYEPNSKLHFDQKSVNFFFDWYVIARSNIVLRPHRTTFSASAIGFGRPEAVWFYRGSRCESLSFREPCFHGRHSRIAHRWNEIFTDFQNYCYAIAESSAQRKECGTTCKFASG